MIQRVVIALCLPAIALAYPDLLGGGHHHAHDHEHAHDHDHAHGHAAATPDVHLETPTDAHAHSAGYDIHPPVPHPGYEYPSPPPVLYVTPTPATPPSPPVLYVTPSPPPSLYGTPDGGKVEEEKEEPTPFKYDFTVSDAEAGLDFGHKSDFNGQAESGQYHVHLPDGRTLTVVYVADATGFHPVITFEGEAHYPEPVPDTVHTSYHYPEPVPDPVHTLYDTPA